MTVVFSDPPPPNNKWQRLHEEIFEACRKRPLEWAEFPGAPSTARHRYGFRFTKRNINGKRKIWVRYDPTLDLSTRRPQKLTLSSSGDSQPANGRVDTRAISA